MGKGDKLEWQDAAVEILPAQRRALRMTRCGVGWRKRRKAGRQGYEETGIDSGREWRK